MERESAKHGPRLDEEIKEELGSITDGAPVEAHAEENRLKEDDEPVPATATTARTELARHLRPAAFPAGRDELVAAARNENAPDDMVAALRRLPAGRTFDNVQAVWSTLGGPTEN